MNWLREADLVETLAIEGESFVFEEIPANFRAFMNEQAKTLGWAMATPLSMSAILTRSVSVSQAWR